MQIENNDAYARRDAIIKMDNLLFKALQIRYKDTFDGIENLKKAKESFRKDTYQNIWNVHKLRNDIVHDDRDIEYNEAVNAYKIYKMAIYKILQ